MRARFITYAAILSTGLLATAGQPARHALVISSQLAGTASRAGARLVQVSHDRYLAHAEPSLAVNPRNSRNLLGASQVIAPGLHTVETFSSFDGGQTWRDNGPLPLPPGADWADDVTVAFDGQGKGFAAAMATVRTAQGLSETARGVYIWRTDDGGRTFHRPVAVVKGQFSDHPWLAAGAASGTRDLYVAWTAAGGLAFSRSIDSGLHFAPPRIISAPPDGALVPMIAAGPTGEVAVAYDQGIGSADAPVVENADGAAAPEAGNTGGAGAMSRVQRSAKGGGNTRIAVVSSIDHGQHFGRPVALGPGAFNFVPGPGLSVPTGPSVTVAANDGALYVAYAVPPAGRISSGILVARSRTHGRTWEAPVHVATSGRAVYFQPQVVVDDAGTVDITYFALTEGRVALLLARSAGRALRFGPALRLTPTPFAPALSQAGSGGKHGAWWIGDYQGLAAGGGQIHPFWNDTRSGRLEIFTMAIAAAGVR